jgi:hypothetical protein
LPTLVDKFLAALETHWPGSTKALRALRAHNEYLEDQGYADIILENLDVSEEKDDIGDGIIWDSDFDMETD